MIKQHRTRAVLVCVVFLISIEALVLSAYVLKDDKNYHYALKYCICFAKCMKASFSGSPEYLLAV